MKIKSIDAFQIFDSRANPTLEVVVELQGGTVGRGLVPSGASTGQFEALELRDGDGSRYRGKSVFRAIGHVKGEIASLVVGRNAEDQEGIDESLIDLDGTLNKSRLGANAILGVSMAVANAAARSKGQQLFEYLGESKGDLLPLPEIQVIGGGAHANWRIDIQDFLVIATGARSFSEVMEITFNVYRCAGDILRERKKIFGLADEGGYWPEFDTNEEALITMVEAIERAGYTPGKEASISLDIAASDFYSEDTGLYNFALEDRSFTSTEFAELMAKWCHDYPIISVEDPMADSDWDGWESFGKLAPTSLQIVGDDLFTTNIERIRQGVERGVANCVLVKLNQIGTVTETLNAIRLTQQSNWLPLISARSGETEDAFITHLAVATNAGQLKVGSLARSERTIKWNEALRIEHYLKGKARFIGSEIYNGIVT